ncbi:unnamed protein product [Rotaria magnacalcarata]|uniref:Uncharacterized protein n=1 Tax=Rotaria magnacalcarata TaxID=392030 RepID=A0A8S3JBR8_9BILA|nr:unnamed protein product [Rotaria magnacalcarata]
MVKIHHRIQIIGDSDLMSLSGSFSSLHIDNHNSIKSDLNQKNGSNQKQSNGLDTNSQTEIHPIITKSTTDEFQLPS